MEKTKPCSFFRSKEGCKKGAECKFLHEERRAKPNISANEKLETQDDFPPLPTTLISEDPSKVPPPSTTSSHKPTPIPTTMINKDSSKAPTAPPSTTGSYKPTPIPTTMIHKDTSKAHQPYKPISHNKETVLDTKGGEGKVYIENLTIDSVNKILLGKLNEILTQPLVKKGKDKAELKVLNDAFGGISRTIKVFGSYVLIPEESNSKDDHVFEYESDPKKFAGIMSKLPHFVSCHSLLDGRLSSSGGSAQENHGSIIGSMNKETNEELGLDFVKYPMYAFTVEDLSYVNLDGVEHHKTKHNISFVFRKKIIVPKSESINTGSFARALYSSFPDRKTPHENIGLSMIPLYIERFKHEDANMSRVYGFGNIVRHGVSEGFNYAARGIFKYFAAETLEEYKSGNFLTFKDLETLCAYPETELVPIDQERGSRESVRFTTTIGVGGMAKQRIEIYKKLGFI